MESQTESMDTSSDDSAVMNEGDASDKKNIDTNSDGKTSKEARETFRKPKKKQALRTAYSDINVPCSKQELNGSNIRNT